VTQQQMADDLRTYLRSMADFQTRLVRPHDTYSSVADLLVREGESFRPARLPKAYQRGQPRYCYANAFQLVQRHPELDYVEGYGYHMIPTQHAWCVVRATGEVVDPTWPWGTPMWEVEDGALLGLRFSRESVNLIAMARGSHGILDDWSNDWPILEQPFDAEGLGLRYFAEPDLRSGESERRRLRRASG
jgi:hypothetical protein